MSIKQAFHQVLGSQIDDYNPPEYWKICGVPVVFKPETGGISAKQWKSVLDEWIPRFESVGWLDGMEKILIGKDEPRGTGVGEYTTNGYILLANDIRKNMLHGTIFEISEGYVFTHEMLHHAHRMNDGFSKTDTPVPNVNKMRRDVSYYAGESQREAIAEIGAGIIHGYSIPNWAHDYYSEHHGPMEVYDIAETL